MKIKFKPILIPNFVLIEEIEGITAKDAKIAVKDLSYEDAVDITNNFVEEFMKKAGHPTTAFRDWPGDRDTTRK